MTYPPPSEVPDRMSKSASLRKTTFRTAAAIAVGALGLTTVAGCSSDGPDPTLKAFLAGWRSGDLGKLAFVMPTGSKLSAADATTQLQSAEGTLKDTPPTLTVRGKPKTTKTTADYTVDVDWTLPGGAHWKYPTTVQLSQKSDAWAVVWDPTIVAAGLTAGDALATERVAASRGEILDGAGKPLVTERPVVVVGVEPRKVSNATTLTTSLAAALKTIDVTVDPAGLAKQIAGAAPDAFVEVVTLRQADYDRIQAKIYPLPGTVFHQEKRQLAPNRIFARALLGSVGPVLKDDMDAHPNTYAIGDQVGHGGIQGQYEERLRGTPGQRVLVTSKTPAGITQSRQIFQVQPVAGQPVRTTLDVTTQAAADLALIGQPRRAAVVAIRISDGAILAAANGPDGGGENLAFTAAVPPGSTFKAVTALGVLDKGAIGLNTVVNCPKTYTVDGRTFKNAHDFVLGPVPLRQDFSQSCNTAFASLAPRLGPDGLATAGASLGIGGDWQLGVNAFTGRVSSGGSAAERAAAAFGQGTTVVSPLAMAVAASTVARGAWKAPAVLLDPAPGAAVPPTPTPEEPGTPTPSGTGTPGPSTAATVAVPTTPLKATSVLALRTMMREVVTQGTAQQLSGIGGAPVFGKTGTAEYDNNPAHTHAWMFGWQGDIAFAVLVENGGGSGDTAVPITAKFLQRLRG